MDEFTKEENTENLERGCKCEKLGWLWIMLLVIVLLVCLVEGILLITLQRKVQACSVEASEVEVSKVEASAVEENQVKCRSKQDVGV